MASWSESIQLLAYKARFAVLDEAKCKSPWLMSPLKDITSHEGIGHTCEKHIGKSLTYLKQRLTEERKIATSSFWSMDAAKAAVCFLTMDKLADIIRWILGSDATILLKGCVPTNSYIGYIVTRSHMVLSNHVTMILHRLPSTELFVIRTAYPSVREV